MKEIFKSDGSHLGYLLELDLNKSEKPFTIALDGTAEEFYCFVEKQLKFSQLQRIDYFEGTQCTCNEECCNKESC